MKHQKICLRCKQGLVSNHNHDLCNHCWKELDIWEQNNSVDFNKTIDNKHIFTVYIMFFGSNEKIGFTNDLDARLVEIKREYANNQLVYFREFLKETEARLFEAWLKSLNKRDLSSLISAFQNKVSKIKSF